MRQARNHMGSGTGGPSRRAAARGLPPGLEPLPRRCPGTQEAQTHRRHLHVTSATSVNLKPRDRPPACDAMSAFSGRGVWYGTQMNLELQVEGPGRRSAGLPVSLLCWAA